MGYIFSSRVRYSEIGADKKLTLPGVLDYFQDCCTFQSESIGQGMGPLEARHRAWVLSAWQVEVKRYPSLGEEIQTETMPYEFRAFFGMRNFLMRTKEGELLAYANSCWVNVNSETGKPEKLTQEDMEGYVVEKKLEMDYASRKIALPEKMDELLPFTIQSHHLDTHHHVNNCQYVRMAIDCLPEDFGVIGKLRVEYKKQALLGDVFYPSIGRMQDKTYIAFFPDKPQENLRKEEPYAIVEVGKAHNC